ncbi:MAG: hypothetical protein LUB59_03305, partial [Candidatus Gastranaerophilales bacterium]|nr:hypothetical protein [Candidatus Gastranaerophilales bacterium]
GCDYMSSFDVILARLKKIPVLFEIKKHEKIFNNRLKYLFYPGQGDNLLVVFSGFTGEKPKYNYFTSFKDINAPKIFILDDFGYMGSYYWYENGTDMPEQLVDELIEEVLKGTGCTGLITAGSSKGGTAAIYYGLKHNAVRIFSGACQYYVGTYLNRPNHLKILENMVGMESSIPVGIINLLDNKLSQIISECSKTYLGTIELVYSMNELTYERQIVPLLRQLHSFSYSVIEDIETFEEHSDIGKCFPKHVIDWFGVKESRDQ